jgi:hypothetical protein
MATPAHRKQGEGEGGSYWSIFRIMAAVAVAVVVVAAGVTTAAVLTGHHGNKTQVAGGGQPQTTGGTGGTGGTGSGTTAAATGSGPPVSGSTSTTATTLPPKPLSVRSVTPATAAKGVATDQVISITFSHPVAAGSPTPTLSPAILGSWSRRGASLVFHPTAGYIPSTQVTVKVPASTRAREDNRSIRLGHSFQTSFSVGTGSVLRLQQLLAELGYLPLSFGRGSQSTSTTTTPTTTTPTTTTPTTTPPTTAPPTTAPPTTTAPTPTTTAPATSTTTHAATTTAFVSASTISSEPVTSEAISTNPKRGQFVWKYPNTPASLQAQWQVGTYNLITKGAVMAFEGDHGLGVDGVAGPVVWTTILKAVAARQMDPRQYDYIMVNEEGTEYLRVWQDGSIVYTTPANTGVPGAATEQGTFAVYTHLPTTTMTGTDVDGTKYVDPGIPYVAYFNGGDAIHGYPRESYGYPQSNGCVELPIPNAGAVFNSGEDWYGTLVTVS